MSSTCLTAGQYKDAAKIDVYENPTSDEGGCSNSRLKLCSVRRQVVAEEG